MSAYAFNTLTSDDWKRGIAQARREGSDILAQIRARYKYNSRTETSGMLVEAGPLRGGEPAPESASATLQVTGCHPFSKASAPASVACENNDAKFSL